MKSSFTFLVLIAFFDFSCNTKEILPPSGEKPPGKQQTPVPPQVISLVGLPDNMQPKTVSMDKTPKPLTVVIPNHEGGSYSIKSANSDVRKIVLKPPVKKMLAVLKDEKGRPVKDASGNPFIMGTGGISNFTNFTSEDGLPLDAITCSMIDKTGNLWFGASGGGISRYDGKSFTTFNTKLGLADNGVTCLFEDRTGVIWIGTQFGGISKYDGKCFTSFNTTSGLPNDYVQAIFEDKAGEFWFGTNGGVSKYDGKTFTNYTMVQGLAGNVVSFISQDKEGNLWFCTNRGASKYDGKSFTNYTTVQGLAGNVVRCMAEGKDGMLWFGTFSGVSKYDGKSFTNLTTGQGLANDGVWSISADDPGNLWFGTNGGVSKYDGKTFTNFTTDQGLANNEVLSITKDRDGNLWFGTFGGGVSKYAGSAFTSFTTVQGLPNNLVFYINEDKGGNLWFGTTAGVTKYDGKSFTTFTTSQGLPDNFVQCIKEDKDGNLWFGTNAGVARYNGKTFTDFTNAQGLVGNVVNGIAEDKYGNLWFATTTGISKFDGKAFINFTTAQGLVNKEVNSITSDKKGNLWISTNGGISRFDGKTFINFTSVNGLANDLAYNITTDEAGSLWISTSAGLSRLSVTEQDKLAQTSPSSNSVPGVVFDNFTTAKGLANDEVYASVHDKKGNIFIGTNLGLTVLPVAFSSLPFSKVSGGIEYFNRPNGYPLKDVNLNALYCDSRGIIWCGTGKDLVRFDYRSLRKTDTETASIITQIKVNGENICWFDLKSGGNLITREDSAKSMFQECMAYGKMIPREGRDSVIKRFGDIKFDSISSFDLLPQNLELPHNHNQVTIDFNAVETNKPQQVEYQYILQGYDKVWSPITKNTSATFGNIYEGNYTFMLKTRKAIGHWSQPVIYNFSVLPPWYRSWWAYSFYALCLLAGIFLTERIRRRVLEEKLLALARVKELAQAKEIEKAYHELKTTQAQLIQSEKMASLGELTAGIAHEIQNPLNFVNNFSEVNKELIDETSQAVKTGNQDEAIELLLTLRENEEKISHHGKRADAIVKGMLQHSRESKGQKESTDINALADEYLRLAYHGLRSKDNSFNATMKTDFDHSIGTINVIPQEIGRVLLNLYNNAFYAVSEKKKSAGSGYEPTVSVSTKKVDNKITISVKDNGNGIPQKVIDKIFQPFFTTKPTGQGTGLGLSLSYDIVKAHGGEIKVETKEGAGTEFTISLPIV
jgi:ligand-binding sensor domain-containing protein/signal transduction histidine kinase